jgi:metallo-beta-lactamase family protein
MKSARRSSNPRAVSESRSVDVEATSPVAHLDLTFHGAAQTVTGSCMEIMAGASRLLVDCGLFQGPRTLEALNFAPFRFAPGEIDALILTHAHIDHSGLLPRLVAEGFAGPIYCTAATGDLLAYMLPDAARIQEWEAERRNQRGDRQDEPPIEPLYREEDARKALALLHPTGFDQWFTPSPGVEARLWNAGHILGSASVELRRGGLSLLFSGDLGPINKTFQTGPQAPVGVDHVVCESTYGDRDRIELGADARRHLLATEIREALDAGGNLIVPVFAIERTQELLFDIATLFHTGELARRPVFIDSPLASQATGVFARHRHELAGVGSEPIFDDGAFHYVESAAQSIQLHNMRGAIILAASGMCEGGRVRQHLLYNLARSNSTVLFVGYQARGTLGRAILDGAARVRISGRDIAVRARIRRIDHYSAHADRAGLIDWIAARRPIAGSLFLDHGEHEAIAMLKEAAGRLTDSVVTPAIGDTYRLRPGVAAEKIASHPVVPSSATESDWQNDYARFSLELKHRLGQIHEQEARRKAITEMGAVLDRYRHRHTLHRVG